MTSWQFISDEFAELASTDEELSQLLSQKSVGTYSNISLESENENSGKCDDSKAGPSDPKKSRGTINIFQNEKVVAALDKCKVSDRDAVHLVCAIAEALGVDINTLTLNRSSIRRHRQKVREIKANHIKKVFQETKLDALVLHWDGKILYDMVKKEMVDRLPVVVSNGKTVKLLGVPMVKNGKGSSQANAVFEVLEDWGLETSVKALCCDTTSSNLGVKKGSAILLEQLLKTNMLFLPCRHHIFELVLRSVFEKKLPGTTGPNVPLFQKFRNSWQNIDQTRYKTGIEDQVVQRLLTSEQIERISAFAQDALRNLQPRDDYKELLQLTLIFLGVVSLRNISFRFPGAFHHARWMAKAIYCLKLFIFREEFGMAKEELEAVRDTSVFIVAIYIEAWFSCPLAVKAPNHDLHFFKKLYHYRSIDKQVSTVTLEKFRNHLWYLNPEAAAMSFFDDTLSFEVKRKMVLKLNPIEEIDDSFSKRIRVDFKDIATYCKKQIEDFVTPQSRNFFLRFEIPDKFLEVDPALWDQHQNYQHGLNIVKHLKIVNDVAERGVHLFTEYNNLLTRNEDQKMFVMQIVSEYRKMFPDSKKDTLLQKF